VGLTLMRLEARIPRTGVPASAVADLARVFSYVYAKKEVFRLLMGVAVVGVFGWCFTTLVPAFTRDILKVGEKGYGFLLAWGGAGALVAALSVATLNRTERVREITVGGVLLFCASAGIFSWSTGYGLSVVAYSLALYALTAFFTAANTFVQVSVPDDMRGAVMGIWTLVFGGMMPLGSLQVGFLGEKLGPEWAVTAGAVVCLVAVLALIRRGSTSGT
jgi:predicted MFS family arabinose efflux permease